MSAAMPADGGALPGERVDGDGAVPGSGWMGEHFPA